MESAFQLSGSLTCMHQTEASLILWTMSMTSSRTTTTFAPSHFYGPAYVTEKPVYMLYQSVLPIAGGSLTRNKYYTTPVHSQPLLGTLCNLFICFSHWGLGQPRLPGLPWTFVLCRDATELKDALSCVPPSLPLVQVCCRVFECMNNILNIDLTFRLLSRWWRHPV